MRYVEEYSLCNEKKKKKKRRNYTRVLLALSNFSKGNEYEF